MGSACSLGQRAPGGEEMPELRGDCGAEDTGELSRCGGSVADEARGTDRTKEGDGMGQRDRGQKEDLATLLLPTFFSGGGAMSR